MQTLWHIYTNTLLGTYPNSVLLLFFFSPAPPLNVLQFCFAAQRGKIEKNSSNSLSHLSRSNNSTSRHMGFGFQFFCSVNLQGALLCWLGAGGSSCPRCAALHHHCFTEQPSFAGALLPAPHQVECCSLACILWPNLPQVGFHLTKPWLFKDPSIVPELCTDTRQPPAGLELRRYQAPGIQPTTGKGIFDSKLSCQFQFAGSFPS